MKAPEQDVKSVQNWQERYQNDVADVVLMSLLLRRYQNDVIDVVLMSLLLRVLTGKKHPQMKLQRLPKVWIWTEAKFLKNNVPKVWIWTETKFSKNKVVAGKTPFFVRGPFYTSHSICLNIGFWYGSFASKYFALSLKNDIPIFWKKVFVFQKICWKVQVLKAFKLFSNCHIKTCQSLKRRAILKIPDTVS